MQNTNNIFQDKRSENPAMKLSGIILPYWPLFLAAIVLGVATALFYLRYKIPVYEASATLIIKDEKKGSEESKLMESLDPISSKKIVENETEILQSRRLFVDVVKKLALYAPISEKSKVKDRSAYLSSPVKIISPHPDSLITTSGGIVYSFTYDKKSQEVELKDFGRYPLDKVVHTPNGKIIFVANPNYIPSKEGAEEEFPFYFSLLNPRQFAPSLRGGLKVEPASKLSSIINLYYRDQIPKRAEDILNQLITSYRQFEIDEKEQLAQNTLQFVENRLRVVEKDLDSIQRRVQQYKSGRGAVEIGTQAQLYLQNVGVNDQKLSEVNTQLSVLTEVENLLKSKKSTEAIVPSTLGISDPLLSQLIDKLYETELEYNKLKRTTGENFPKLTSLRDQIERIRPNILQNIESQKRSLLATRNNIRSTNTGYDAMLRTVPQKEMELLEISREEQIKRNNYLFLLQKKEESEIAYASTVANNKVVDYAQAGTSPVSPKRNLIMAFVVMVFIGLAFAFILTREYLTGKVMYRDEIESKTSMPVIGEIAYNKEDNPIVIKKRTRSFIAEEFRKLRISLSFLGLDETRKKLLITSSISGEGKSFISTNLAISIALTGKKVVLVDMDLNNPTLGKMLNLERNKGVADYLEETASIKEIIRPVHEHENLSFISAGTLPDDPTELLSKRRTEELIDYLNDTFDMVIIDTSPMALVTDGYLLTNLCDATLYVVRHQYTPKIVLRRLDQNNRINPIKNPGIIFNGVKSRGFFKNDYGYGYGYVYGNGYEYGSTKKRTKKSLVKT